MSAVLASQVKTAAASEISSGQMSAAGLRAFARIAQAWGLSVEEQLALLGQPPRSTFFAWRKHPEKAALSRDTLERLSNILGIYKGLQILLPDPCGSRQLGAQAEHRTALRRGHGAGSHAGWQCERP
jgi:hypothetical protein